MSITCVDCENNKIQLTSHSFMLIRCGIAKNIVTNVCREVNEVRKRGLRRNMTGLEEREKLMKKDMQGL